MKVKLIKDHPTEWERIEFPTFKKGTMVVMDELEDNEFRGWYSAVIGEYNTFVPSVFVKGDKLTRDYNPTELAGVAGDIVTVKEIVNAWLLVEDSKGVVSWVPADVCVSVGE